MLLSPITYMLLSLIFQYNKNKHRKFWWHSTTKRWWIRFPLYSVIIIFTDAYVFPFTISLIEANEPIKLKMCFIINVYNMASNKLYTNVKSWKIIIIKIINHTYCIDNHGLWLLFLINKNKNRIKTHLKMNLFSIDTICCF